MSRRLVNRLPTLSLVFSLHHKIKAELRLRRMTQSDEYRSEAEVTRATSMSESGHRETDRRVDGDRNFKRHPSVSPESPRGSQ
jgi:hypothetical protein